MKKLTAALLAIFLIAGMAACSSGGGQSQAPADSSTTAPSESGSAPADSGAETVINVWAWDVEYNIPVMQEAGRRYEAAHPDVKVNAIEYAYDDVVLKINTNLASGISDGLPEIMLSEDANAQKYLLSYPGAFRDMTDEINYDDFADYKTRALTVDGRVYGVPFDTGTEALFYRKDYMDEAGVTEEELEMLTWDKYIEIGKRVKEATGKDMLNLDPNSMNFMRDAMQASGTWYFTPEGELNIAGNPVIIEGTRVYKDIMDAGIVKLTTGWGDMVAALNNGDIASITTGCWIVPTITAADDQSGLWRITNMPRIEAEGGTNYGNRGGSNWLVLSDAPNSDAAAAFLNEIFAGDVDFYQTILTDIGAIGTYLPAGSGEAYNTEQPFFGGQKIWATFSDWSEQVPPINVGIYSDEADVVLINGMSEVLSGATDIETMLQNAQDQLAQQIQ